MSVAIQVSDLSKKYRTYHDRAPTLKERMLFSNRQKYEDFWVLKNINLEIAEGETVGLIGVNGSGKSTLLKLMTRIIYPDTGKVILNGKVTSLLELGAGFHPDFTGMENIYMNAAIFGLTKKEIEKKIPDILAFSEIGDFIDVPVRTYSSGMYMRLAFSIAINVEAKILLIDEILAVGDEAFQEKCFQKIAKLKEDGMTIVIVSHALGQIVQFCDRAVWLKNGRIQADGKPLTVVAQFRGSAVLPTQ